MSDVIKDDDGQEILAGDRVSFSYGIPPICVVAPVVDKDGELYVLTPEHNPKECPLAKLEGAVGAFWKEYDND